MRIQSNGVEMPVNQESKIPGYNKSVWFRIRAITNIITIRNLTEQY